MKQLGKEQVPKVIALGVVATGLLGYAGYSWLGGGGGGATPAVASTPHPAPTAALPADAPPTNPALQLASIDHEDPFRPAIVLPTGNSGGNKPAPKPAAKPAATQVAAKPPAPALADSFTGPPMDALPGVVSAPRVPDASTARPAPPAGGGPAPATSAPAAHPPAAKPAPAARPEPPAIVVTGILEGDENVAILKWSDDHRQVVRAGDRLDGGFVVRAIRPDAVTLTRGSFQWTARLGAAKPTGN
jgi:hypothetical protein